MHNKGDYRRAGVISDSSSANPRGHRLRHFHAQALARLRPCRMLRRVFRPTAPQKLAPVVPAAGVEEPTRDRKRPRKGSNQDWRHPHDPEARITKMKDGRTHLAPKLEPAVGRETGAMVAPTVQTMGGRDGAYLPVTLDEVEPPLAAVGAEAQEGWPTRATIPTRRWWR